MVVLTCNPSHLESIGRRIMIQNFSQAKNTSPYLKNIESKKRARASAQVTECLRSKHKALNSNPKAAKNLEKTIC
jgi:hypothetical protein